MAIYHFSAQIIGRAAGCSAVSAAAYRSGERLHDERLDRDHDYRAKAGVVHSEVMLPDHAHEEWRDRERLWNDVEAAELRKDAQLAPRGLVLSGEQRDAFAHVTDGRGLSLVTGAAGAGKSAMLGVAREAWESAGYEMRGVALSSIAAEGLQQGSGIASRTIASVEHG